MKTEVSQAIAERLYADDWRVESTILDGPRIVKDMGSCYATIVPTPENYGWAIWEWMTGQHLASGTTLDVTEAASAAMAWVEKEWLISAD
jgi:hypothetical protein